MKSVGLLGGSFDPPHKGHLYISLEAKKILKLDEIWWLVTPQNPLKIAKPATYEERIKNCHAITKKLPIKVTDIEHKINSSYSYESLYFIQNYYKKKAKRSHSRLAFLKFPIILKALCPKNNKTAIKRIFYLLLKNK